MSLIEKLSKIIETGILSEAEAKTLEDQILLAQVKLKA